MTRYTCSYYPTETAWVDWNTGTYATSATSATAYVSDASSSWPIWVKVSATSATTHAVTLTWNGWCRSDASTTHLTAPTATVTAREVTLEDPAVVEERRRVAQLAREAYERRQAEIEAEAAARAEALLVAHLDETQRAQHAVDRSFVVVTESGRRYRLRRGWAGNVEEVDAGDVPLRRYCIHPSVGVPHPDNQLVQKLMLETDEGRFLRIANATDLRRGAATG